ncbi:MAG: virulence RhuM family protein [Oscillospiraceae bacterium]|nr:virulence RhuM family protein [Oscillospiraceae bacterium]
MSENNTELIIYQTEDGTTKIDVYFQGDNAWLSKAQMAELFQRDRSVISRHVRNVFDEGELDEKSNVQKMHIANSDKPVEYYSLDVIISVGYRVKSLRGTQFRIWANSVLKEYLIKGFAMNDDLLKQSGGGNYFDELLERIRDIRSSEKVFWRKVLDIYATSVDYSANAEESVLFFKTVQNKMLYAATGMTAAELVSGRANALLPMMGMTVVKGKRPTLAEAKTAKNYLNEEELGTLNRLVSAYLDLAELQAMRKKPMYMKDWVARLDDYLRMTDSEVLQNAGKVSHALAEQKAKEEYRKYKQLHSGELSRVEQAFLESVEATAKRLEGK